MTSLRGSQRVPALISAVLLVAALVWTLPELRPTAALSCRQALLPNGGRGRCANCHINPNGGGDRNLFGRLVDSVALGCNAFWNSSLAREDSDRDGLTNGEELLDPEGTWRPGSPNPGNPAQVSNPGMPQGADPQKRFFRGDCNGDGRVAGTTDAVTLLTATFVGGATIPCRAACDANADGELGGVIDAIMMLQANFVRATVLLPPRAICGPAMLGSDVALGCELGLDTACRPRPAP